MKKRHGILWYFTIFPFVLMFYIGFYLLVFSAYVLLFILQLPFKIFQLCFNQLLKVFKIEPTRRNTVSNGIEYEQFCANYLNHHGYRDVTTTKASGDHGVDIIAYKHRKKYAIQCKYYSSPVGNHAVQEVFAGKAFYHCDYAIVMTNSTFTKQAKEEAYVIGVKLMPLIEPQGKFFQFKSIIAFMVFALVLAYPKEAAITLSTIIFIYILILLARKTYMKRSLNISAESDVSDNDSDYETADMNHESVQPEISDTVNYNTEEGNNNSINTIAECSETIEYDDYKPNYDFAPLSSEIDDLDISDNECGKKKVIEKPKATKEYTNHKKKTVQKKLSASQLETFMVSCNAKLEHEDEMEQYKQ